MIGLIALYSSYDHFNVFGQVIPLNQQFGIWFIIASLAVVVVVAAGFCAAVAQLASRSRLRAANEAVESRERGARQEVAQFLRARVEAEARQAQLAYLARPTVDSREQLEQVLSKLSRPEVRALFEDEAGAMLPHCGAFQASTTAALLNRSTAVLPASGVLSPMNGQDQDHIALLPEVDGIGKLPHDEPSHHPMHTWK